MKTLANFRSICKLFGDAAATVFFDSLANKYVLYPRAENMARYLKMLDAIPFLEEYVQELQVVRDTISVHKHGYEWTWKGVPGSQHWTSSDLQLATDIEEIHQEELTKTTQYLMKGGFYNDLTKILRKCTHLKWMVVRHLHVSLHPTSNTLSLTVWLFYKAWRAHSRLDGHAPLQAVLLLHS